MGGQLAGLFSLTFKAFLAVFHLECQKVLATLLNGISSVPSSVSAGGWSPAPVK
jgi:hypothetical protein